MKQIILAFILAIVMAGCTEEKSLFEKRYVMINIPGYGTDDYIELMDSDDPNVCYLAVAYLIEKDMFKTNDEQLKHTLAKKVKLLMQGPSAKVRAITAVSSDAFDDSEFEKPLAKLLTDINSAVRVDALFTLGKFSKLSDQTIDTIIKCLDDDNVLVRLQALETMGKCDSDDQKQKATVKILTELDECPKFEQLKRIETLGRLAHSDAKKTLLSLLDSDDIRIVKVTITALGNLGSKDAVAPLLRILAENRVDVSVIVDSLAKIDPDTLVGLLESEDQGVRIAAIRKLQNSPSSEVLKIVISKLKEREPLIWEKLNTVAGHDLASQPEFISLYETMIKLYTDLNDKENLYCQTHDFLTSTKLHEKLLAMAYLNDGKPFDLHVIPANQASPDYVSVLVKLSREPSPVVRLFALQILGNSVDRRAGETLLKGIDDKVFAVQYASIEAIAKYVSNSGEYKIMAKLYDAKDHFIPTTYAPEDKNLALRQLIEQSLANLENPRITQQRHLAELSEKNSSFTRLHAAVLLCVKDKNQTGRSLLFDFLETGSAGEKKFALEAVEKTASPKDLERLQRIKDQEKDDELRSKLDELIKKLTHTQAHPPLENKRVGDK